MLLAHERPLAGGNTFPVRESAPSSVSERAIVLAMSPQDLYAIIGSSVGSATCPLIVARSAGALV